MDTQELVDRYQSGDRDLRWSDLTRADLSEMDLPEINLSGSDMTWAKLTGCNLRQANLEMVDLSMADLRGADLTGADMRGVYLRWARLDGAILERVNLEGAVVNELKLERARSLAGAIMPNGAQNQEPPKPLLTEDPAKNKGTKLLPSLDQIQDVNLATRALHAPPEVLDALLDQATASLDSSSNGDEGDHLGARSLDRFRSDPTES